MSGSEVLDVAREAIWLTLQLAAPILLVGLLGGFTTFSSYAFQSVELLEGGRPLTAVAYVIGTNIAALAAVWAGLRIAGG